MKRQRTIFKALSFGLIFTVSQFASAIAEVQKVPDIFGTWTGTAAQNIGESNYTVVLTITSTGAESNYPELNCGGRLTRVGESNGYVFFSEAITHGGKNSGGSCIDGTVTVAPAGKKLAWGWVGSYEGQVFVAWSNLVRK